MPRIRRLFQPPLPLRGATPDEFYVRCLGWFQPTLPLRGATVQRQHVVVAVGVVSTHAPLAGSDVRGHERRLVERVSTHAPLAGSDPLQTLAKDPVVKFQPTLPLRGATSPRGPSRRPPSRFNPRSPCGERPGNSAGLMAGTSFQPTLPLRGATLPYLTYFFVLVFQPTLPLRGATSCCSGRWAASGGFNPRSPCGERRGVGSCLPRPCSFNPRSPCGERPPRSSTVCSGLRFQPTLPLRGATLEVAFMPDEYDNGFNPRSPCGERPSVPTGKAVLGIPFQPTLPLRGATAVFVGDDLKRLVSTHAPLAGSDLAARERRLPLDVSTHAPLAGGDASPFLFMIGGLFQPTLPLRGATPQSPGKSGKVHCFNPRSPCGERPIMSTIDKDVAMFQPTLPLRGATAGNRLLALARDVSTHAPLAGSD